MIVPRNPNRQIPPFELGSFDSLRQIRGWTLAQDPRRTTKRVVEKDGTEHFLVPSQTQPGVLYDVFIDVQGKWVCTPCPDFASNHAPDKHIFETIYRYYPEFAPPPPLHLLNKILQEAPPDKPHYADARRFPHEPYQYAEGFAESTRDDHAYEEQEERFLDLVIDLALKIDRRHPRFGVGRRPLSPGQKALVIVHRVYERKSIRRYRAQLRRLVKDGVIRFDPCRSVLIDYQTQTETIEILMEAYEIVTAVFRLMEQYIIADATGFSPFYISNWLDSKHGTENYRNATEWYKQHCIIGRISKAMLGFMITPNRGVGTGDLSNLVPMLENLRSRGFEVADTAITDNVYLVPENFSALRALGFQLIGPLKPRNFDKHGKPRKGMVDLVDYARTHRGIYDEIVRARNSIEAVFWAQKRDDNHIAAIGTQEERAQHGLLLHAATQAESEEEFEDFADEAAASGLYVSRMVTFIARAIVQVMKRTITMEHRFNRRISYCDDSVFSCVREYSPEPGDDAA